MTIVKRKGYPDITNKDLKPINEIEIEMTPINPVRHEVRGARPVQLPDLIIIAHNPEFGERIKTTIIGDEDD